MTRLLSVIILLLILVGCATHPPLLSTEPAQVSGALLDTLRSTVTLSLHSAEKNLAGRGVMVYRRPDQLRLIILSPFGTTVMEAQLAGNQLTLAYPSSGVAYRGTLGELPATAGQQPLAMLRWVLAFETPAGGPKDGIITRPTGQGEVEQIRLANGLVVEKRLSDGQRVRYHNYTVLAGVPVPLELRMDNADGDHIRLTLEEPEVNIPLADHLFAIPLQGLRLFPLASLKDR